jgi:hypothetical protein
MKRLRVVKRELLPGGASVHRLEGGRSVYLADGTTDGDGWTWAVTDTEGNIYHSGGGLTSKHAAWSAAKAYLRG